MVKVVEWRPQLKVQSAFICSIILLKGTYVPESFLINIKLFSPCKIKIPPQYLPISFGRSLWLSMSMFLLEETACKNQSI